MPCRRSWAPTAIATSESVDAAVSFTAVSLSDAVVVEAATWQTARPHRRLPAGAVTFQLGDREIAGVQCVDAASADQATRDQRVPFKPSKRPRHGGHRNGEQPGDSRGKLDSSRRRPTSTRVRAWPPNGLDDVLTNISGHMTTYSGLSQGTQASGRQNSGECARLVNRVCRSRRTAFRRVVARGCYPRRRRGEARNG